MNQLDATMIYWSIRSAQHTLDQRSGKWQSKNTTIFVGTIIYQLHVSALIGHLQVGIRQRKISIISIGMGGRDLVYKCMGFVVESVLEQACVRLVCTSVGLVGLGLECFGQYFAHHQEHDTEIFTAYDILLLWWAGRRWAAAWHYVYCKEGFVRLVSSSSSLDETSLTTSFIQYT